MYKRIIAWVLPLLFVATGLSAKDFRVAVFKVEQLECKNCAAKVVKNLRFERGVKAIDTDVPERTVSVTYDADKTSVEKLVKAFGKFDYRAVFVRETPFRKGAPASRTDGEVAA